MENLINKKYERYIKLDSVGSWLDCRNGEVFPQTEGNGYDLDMVVNLEECTDEWFDALNSEDFNTCKLIIQKLLYNRRRVI